MTPCHTTTACQICIALLCCCCCWCIYHFCSLYTNYLYYYARLSSVSLSSLILLTTRCIIFHQFYHLQSSFFVFFFLFQLTHSALTQLNLELLAVVNSCLLDVTLHVNVNIVTIVVVTACCCHIYQLMHLNLFLSHLCFLLICFMLLILTNPQWFWRNAGPESFTLPRAALFFAYPLLFVWILLLLVLQLWALLTVRRQRRRRCRRSPRSRRGFSPSPSTNNRCFYLTLLFNLSVYLIWRVGQLT